MDTSVNCPRCGTPTAVPEGESGATVRCPRCGPVPADNAPAKGEGRSRCPHCGGDIARAARKCLHCKRWLPEEPQSGHGDFEGEVGAGAGYMPCPRCGTGSPERVLFTFWGSFYGPLLFSHVRCRHCGKTYNGKSGRSNLLPAILFVSLPLLCIVLLIGWVIWVVMSTVR